MEARKRFVGQMRRLFIVGFGLALIASGVFDATAQPATPSAADADVPLAPILPIEFDGWTNAIRLANTNLELVVIPALGRIMTLRFQGGTNILRFDRSLAGIIPDKKQAQWFNAGGEWLWPMAQSAWPQIAESDWPPPTPLADTPWNATAWTAADGSLNCTLTRSYGRPLYLKVSRLIRLDAQGATFSIRQRIERTRPSEAPVSLWNIFQVSAARSVLMPVDAESRFDGGFRPLMFAAPPENQWERCGNVLAYHVVSGEHKLCSDSARGWIAALREDVWLVVRVRNDASAGEYPDGGCILEMYSNAGLGYTEIETLSPEVVLKDGASLQNEIVVHCLPPPSYTNICAAAEALRLALGEAANLLSGSPEEATRSAAPVAKEEE